MFAEYLELKVTLAPKEINIAPKSGSNRQMVADG